MSRRLQFDSGTKLVCLSVSPNGTSIGNVERILDDVIADGCMNILDFTNDVKELRDRLIADGLAFQV